MSNRTSATRVAAWVLAAILVGAAPATWSQSSPDAYKTELRKLPDDLRHDCTVVGLPAMSLEGIYMGSSTPELRLKNAALMEKMAKGMKVPRVQKNFSTVAQALREHANDTAFKPPKLEAAMADTAEWHKANCPSRP
jgi:hypothetical protein